MERDQSVDISVVIPIHNEEEILRGAVRELAGELSRQERSWEIVLAENGSTDRTAELAREICDEIGGVRHISAPRPDYGLALRQGIEIARGRIVACDEIDICDVGFHLRAVEMLDRGEAEMVVGSKAMPGAEDRRPLGRRAATLVINGMLRALLGFRGTDTHGLKAFRREALLPVVESCIVGRDLFASEFVIRAQREGLRVVEIPVAIAEKRAPSINLKRRVPAVIMGLTRLFVAIRLGR
ncbi:MAG: glycosyltransferase family 2 protein [Polyangia bacterium]